MNKKLRVLSVEDSERDAALVRRHLTRAGYELVCDRVDTAEAMRAALKSQMWDVILCDYSMPNFNALAALSLLHEMQQDIPFIIISGTIGEEVAVGAMLAGAHDYLMKNNLPRLVPAIERELHEAENRNARRKAELALLDSEDRYRDLVVHSQELICTHDLAGRLISVNPWAARVLGYDLADLLKRNLRDLVVPEFRANFDDYLKVVQKEGHAQGLMLVQTATGDRRLWEYNNSLRTEGVKEPIVRGMAHDITEQKQAEEQLKLRENQLAEAQNLARIGSWNWNLPNDELTWSDEHYRIFGLDPRVDAVPSYENVIRDFVHPEDRRLFTSAVENSLAANEPFNIHSRVIRSDGRVRTVHWRGSITCDANGNAIRMFGTAQDVTEIKAAEEKQARLSAELENERRRLNNIIASVPGVVWEAWGKPDSATQRIDFVNDYVETMLGYSVAEWLSTPNFWLSIVHPDDRARTAQAAAADFASGKDSTLEFRWVTRDGRAVWVESNSTLVCDAEGKPAGLRGVTMDITERKLAEERNINRAALASLRADIIGGLAESDLSQQVVLNRCAEALVQNLDAAFVRIWTLNREENVLELQASAGLYTHRDGAHSRVPVGSLKIGRIAQDLRPHITNEVQSDPLVSDKEWAKREAIVSFAGYPLMVHDRLVGVMALFSRHELAEDALDALGAMAEIISQDLERKRIEEALRVSEDQLRQSQKLEAIGMLAGGIAHDFNNLLTTITGYSELALRRLRTEDPLHRNISEVKTAADRAASLTRQLLAFSRKQVLQPKIINLNMIVSELEKMLRRLIGEDVSLRVVIEEELGNVKADPGQIEQVLMNLAVNARDAMPEGGKLTIETTNVYLDDRYARKHLTVIPGHYVMLAVSDTGTGMDENTQAHIFEPFFTTKEVGKGTGLGLSTVYGIVKQSGGSIWVYSEPGRGTSFKIYFPRVDERPRDSSPKAAVEENLQGTETILLTEDEDMVRTLAREVLEMYGYRVLEAANGGAALLICERHLEPIQLLLTDVVMPEMGGHVLANRLKLIKPDMKVLFMSGYTDNAIVHQGFLEEGANFIQKPFSPDAMARKVREVLDGE